MNEAFQAALRVVDVLGTLKVDCFLGGSLASSIHGTPRSTLDADLVADLKHKHAEPFVAALRDEFYVDLHAVRSAIEQRSSFNLIHLATAFKVDVFVPKPRPYDRVQLRRLTRPIVDPETNRTAPVCTPEDIILAKLEWYRLGGEVSERQWHDILGVLQVQGLAKLDLEYLEKWSAQLNLADLLQRALNDADLE